jgi:aminoglycoside 3-N-acetyltransferase I
LEFVVRRFGPDDADLAVELVRLHSHGSVTRDHMGSFLSNAANYLIVAMVGDRPAGSLLAHRLDRLKEESYKLFIYEIDVAEEFRRRGIGTKLIEFAREIVQRESMICAFVLTDKRNEAAIGLYKSTGGVAINGDDLMFVYDPRQKRSGSK